MRVFCGINVTAEDYLRAIECPFQSVSDTGYLVGLPCDKPKCCGEIPEGKMRYWNQKCPNGLAIWDVAEDAIKRHDVSWFVPGMDLEAEYIDVFKSVCGRVLLGRTVELDQPQASDFARVEEQIRKELHRIAKKHRSWTKISAAPIYFSNVY